MANKSFLCVVLAIVCACAAACGPAKAPKASNAVLFDRAFALMNKNDFRTARILLDQSLKLDPNNAKANYSLAVCYLRSIPPDLDTAMDYRMRAQKLGYVVPQWFDSYYNFLRSKAKKAKK